jgi:hypothetical protein
MEITTLSFLIPDFAQISLSLAGVRPDYAQFVVFSAIHIQVCMACKRRYHRLHNHMGQEECSSILGKQHHRPARMDSNQMER